MGWNNRTPSALDPAVDPLLPQADSSQGHDIPTGVSPTTAKLQDWIAWLSANGVFYSSPGVVDGPIEIDGNLSTTGTLDVGTSATVGSDLTVGDDLFVADDATIGDNLTVSGNASVTGTLTASSSASVGTDLSVGDDLTVTGDASFGGALTLTPARSWTRHSLRICNVSYVGTGGPPTANYEGPERPTAWVTNGGSTDPLDPLYIRTLPTNTDTHSGQHYHWIALDGLPDGGTFTQVVVLCDGHNTPTTTARFQIVRMSQSGTVETMSSLTDKSGSFGVQTQTTVTVTSNGTISSDYHYALVVTHPLLTGSGSGSWIEIGDVEASGTVSAVPIA